MGLSWQQGPLSPSAVGAFLVPEPLPNRWLYAEPLRRRMRVRLGGSWIADSEEVLLPFEPGHYPTAYFREADVSPGAFERTDPTTPRPDLGPTSWCTVRAGDKSAARGAWRRTEPGAYARGQLRGRVAFAWPAMDAFYEGERVLGHGADRDHRIDIRQSSRRLVTRHGDPWLPMRSGQSCSVSPVLLRAGAFCGRISMSLPRRPWNIKLFARTSYAVTTTWMTHIWRRGRIVTLIPRAGGISDLASFEPDIVSGQLDGVQLRLEPGQTVIPHGPDRDLDVAAATGKQT